MDRFLANAVTGFHFIWLFLVMGGMAALFFFPKYALIQIIVMSVTILVNLPFRNICPLTLIEEQFRQKIEPGYVNNNSFATTYFNKIFGTQVRKKTVNTVIVVVYILAYGLAIWDLARRT